MLTLPLQAASADKMLKIRPILPGQADSDEKMLKINPRDVSWSSQEGIENNLQTIKYSPWLSNQDSQTSSESDEDTFSLAHSDDSGTSLITITSRGKEVMSHPDLPTGELTYLINLINY